MKKFTLLLCLFAATIAQAQTKEETIEWINLYAGDYLQLKHELGNYDWSVKVDNTGKIEFKETKKIFNSEKIVFNAQDITSIYLKDKPSEFGLYYLFISIKDSKTLNGSREVAQVYIKSYDDLKRVYKALVKYASFFGYKEKVARDTF